MLETSTFLSALKTFFDAFLLEVVIVLLFSGGLLAFALDMIRTSLYGKWSGVSRIHKKGKDIKSLKRAILNAKEVCILGFVPYNFVFDNRELLIQKIQDGCKINILHCEYASPVLKELSQIDNRTDWDVPNKIKLLENELRSIKSYAKHGSTGYFEIRKCSAEIRNPCIICYGKNNMKRAFLTVSIPPKRSIESLMLEFRKEQCNDIITYFDTIWGRHDADKIKID